MNSPRCTVNNIKQAPILLVNTDDNGDDGDEGKENVLEKNVEK